MGRDHAIYAEHINQLLYLQVSASTSNLLSKASIDFTYTQGIESIVKDKGLLENLNWSLHLIRFKFDFTNYPKINISSIKPLQLIAPPLWTLYREHVIILLRTIKWGYCFSRYVWRLRHSALICSDPFALIAVRNTESGWFEIWRWVLAITFPCRCRRYRTSWLWLIRTVR